MKIDKNSCDMIVGFEKIITNFSTGKISLGQLSKILEKDKRDVMKLLSKLKIDVINYDFHDDIKNIENFNNSIKKEL